MGVERRQDNAGELSRVRRPPYVSSEELQLEGYEDLALNLHQCWVARRCVEHLARQVGKYGVPSCASRMAGEPSACELF